MCTRASCAQAPAMPAQAPASAKPSNEHTHTCARMRRAHEAHSCVPHTLLAAPPRHNQVGVTLLLDDFPRTLEQAREFERMIGSPVMVLRRAAGQGPRPRSSRGPVLSFGVEAQTDRREGGGLSVPAHARGISPGTRVHCRLHTSIFPLRRRVRRCCFSSCPRF